MTLNYHLLFNRSTFCDDSIYMQFKRLNLIRMQHIGMCTYMYHYSTYILSLCKYQVKSCPYQKKSAILLLCQNKKISSKNDDTQISVMCTTLFYRNIVLCIVYNSLLFLLFKTHCPLCKAPVLSYKTYSVHVP